MGGRAGIGVGVLKRRGLLAGAAALLAGGLAKLGAAQRVQAAHDGSPDQTVLHADTQNTTSGTTTIFRSGGAGVTTLQVYNTASGGVAVVAQSTGTGIGGAGLYGVNNTPAFGDLVVVGGVGVFGFNNSTEPTARGIGVWGQVLSATGVGVRGENRADDARAIGVQGVSQNTDSGALLRGIGVQGLSGAGTGVRGASTSGFGVHGSSQSGVGVFGGSSSNVGVFAESVYSTGAFAAGARGVWGRTTNGIGVLAQATAGGTVQNRSYGLYAAAPAPGWAGYFEGNVYVTGQVIQAGAAASTATAADGSTRILYSQDSTEPLVEDVGEGKLVGGRAEVRIGPDFAAVADGGAYQVFLTPEGDSKGLYVTEKGPGGFVVREQQNGTASLAFAYRVVAKRKGAIGKRLERIERPRGLSAKELEPPKLPEAPTQPEKPPTEPRPEPPRPGRQDAR